MSTDQEIYDLACRHVRETAVLNSIGSLLGWDERTMLPPAAGDFRAEQMTLLSGMTHDRWTDRRFGDWLAQLAESPLAADPTSDTGATIRQLKRRRDKQVKLPKTLVEELTSTAVLGQQVWVEARKNNDFAAFRPLLEKTFALKRQEAEALGYDDVPYDALLDDYEPQETTANVTRVLAGLREQLVPLVQEVAAVGRKPERAFLRRVYPIPAQQAFGREVAERIGFDFQRGRLDVTAHPFCSGMGPNDCRITTRYTETNPVESLFGTLHEAGHGIYEQGLRSDQYGLPLGDAVSLGIHESQSRMWENLVGRSQAFWRHFWEPARRTFGPALADVALEAWVAAINVIEPSLIRIEADEATYNLHILIRFELEQELIADRLQVADLPAAWNTKYRDYLGITPPDDARGVMQDIHWSAGLVGYFATYSLGNLYAAQFFEAADRELGGLHAQFAAGQFAPLRDWLRTKIHSQGQRYTAAQLVQRITGQPLSHAALIRHLRGKFGPLYGLQG